MLFNMVSNPSQINIRIDEIPADKASPSRNAQVVIFNTQRVSWHASNAKDMFKRFSVFHNGTPLMHQLSLCLLRGLQLFKVLQRVDVINLFCSIFQEKQNVPKSASGKVVIKDRERLSVVLTSPS